MYQFTDYYSFLNINAEATTDEILAAFAKEARGRQLDSFPDFDSQYVMQYKIEARRILLNPILRASYNREYFKLKGNYEFSEPVIPFNEDWLIEVENTPLQNCITVSENEELQEKKLETIVFNNIIEITKSPFIKRYGWIVILFLVSHFLRRQ